MRASVPSEVLIELPREKVLEAVRKVLARHQKTGATVTYLRTVTLFCQQPESGPPSERFFITPAKFYHVLMLEALPTLNAQRPLTEDELADIFEVIHEISGAVTTIQHPLTERFALKLYGIAPILIPAVMERTIRPDVLARIPVPATPATAAPELTLH